MKVARILHSQVFVDDGAYRLFTLSQLKPKHGGILEILAEPTGNHDRLTPTKRVAISQNDLGQCKGNKQASPSASRPGNTITFTYVLRLTSADYEGWLNAGIKSAPHVKAHKPSTVHHSGAHREK